MAHVVENLPPLQITLFGSASSGKTKLYQRLISNEYFEESNPSSGIMRSKVISNGDFNYKLADASGQYPAQTLIPGAIKITDIPVM
ncbi:MAG: hypothetical protein H0U57_08155 [Tatlockia sp.]|nr:hypothetical protein [Tatlockia sp.]